MFHFTENIGYRFYRQRGLILAEKVAEKKKILEEVWVGRCEGTG